MLRRLAQEMPNNADVRELIGLVHYRLGRWADAIKDLEAARSLSNNQDQHPVLADCYRAQRRWDDVDRLWEELREASPNADLVSEGRIVAAGALADRGMLVEALALLSSGSASPASPNRSTCDACTPWPICMSAAGSCRPPAACSSASPGRS